MPPKILSINISEGVVLPSKEEKEIIVFKPDEQLAIIEAARKNRLGFAIKLDFFTAFRSDGGAAAGNIVQPGKHGGVDAALPLGAHLRVTEQDQIQLDSVDLLANAKVHIVIHTHISIFYTQPYVVLRMVFDYH